MDTLKGIQLGSFTLYQKRSFKGALNNVKLAGISLLIQWGQFGKMNISFIVYFCHGKYRFSLDSFRTCLVYLHTRNDDTYSLSGDTLDAILFIIKSKLSDLSSNPG